jgi:Flp pilus assembly secretin CpaC
VLVTGIALDVSASKLDLESVRTEKSVSNVVSITLGKGEMLSLSGEVSDILVANPAILSAICLPAPVWLVRRNRSKICLCWTLRS